MSGESMFWSQQAVSTLINPPFALSLVGLLVGFIFLLKYLDNKQNKYAFGIVIIFGVLIQIKAYAGALGLGALWVTGVYRFLKHKQFDLLSFTLIASIVSLLLFIPLNSGAQGLIVWQPFWFLENMMLLSDRVGWQRYGEAMVNYKNGGNLVKFIPSYAIAFLLFYMGNMGTRLFKEFYVYKKIKTRKISEIEISIAAIILAGILIPTFFIQRGTPWNTIQFSYYTLFFSSIIAGVAVSEVAKSRVISIAIILLTIPTSIITLKNDYLPNRPPAKISKGELEALEFLSNEPEGVVLTYPYDELKAKEAEKNPPRPLALYVSTAYVSAFSNKLVYLEDEINLDITNYEWRERKENLVEFYASLNHEFAQGFLMENNISYIYWLKGQRARLGESQLGIIRIFENSEVDIYRVEASTFAREIQ
jgi:hypothetical protein